MLLPRRQDESRCAISCLQELVPQQDRSRRSSLGREEKTLSSTSITPTSASMTAVSRSQTAGSGCGYLLEGLQHLRSLAEVFEDELQRARHQRGVVLHDEMDQNPQECPAALVIQLHST